MIILFLSSSFKTNSCGIGEEIALCLAEFGAHVIVSSRRIEGCQSVADKIVANSGSAEPSEMAGAVMYLASGASSYTNGECIVVDGGLTV